MRSIARMSGSLVAVSLGVLALAGCGRSGYQYIESEDAHVFAKLPESWTITADGIVNPTLIPPDATDFSFLPGDDTLPWRAEFTDDPDGEVVLDQPSGYMTAQPVDARLRDSIDLAALLPFDPNDTADEFELIEQLDVRSGELRGLRMSYTAGSGAGQLLIQRLVLTDDGTSVVYVVQVGCSTACVEDNQDVIDEMMRTFTVER